MKFSMRVVAAYLALGAGIALADERQMPEGFDELIWAELQKVAPADRDTILSFDTIGDGTGKLPSLPIARLGPDGVSGSADDLQPKEWIRLGGLLREAQTLAAEERAAIAQRKAHAAQALVEKLEEMVNN